MCTQREQIQIGSVQQRPNECKVRLGWKLGGSTACAGGNWKGPGLAPRLEPKDVRDSSKRPVGFRIFNDDSIVLQLLSPQATLG